MFNALEENFSIVIPTYHEAVNIPELVTQIAKIDFGKRSFEVLLIDDNSQDGIIEIANRLSKQYSWLKLIVRKKKRDLSQSIITGFQAAKYPLLVTMDADLSHPPTDILHLLTTLEQPGTDMVIGSRYIKGGSTDDEWPVLRKISSQMAAFLARILLPTPIKDPLSGFIAFRKRMFLNASALEPIGWKIGLELIVKSNCKNIREIPIHFSQRKNGHSKLNIQISVDYFRHILKLFYFKYVTIYKSKT